MGTPDPTQREPDISQIELLARSSACTCERGRTCFTCQQLTYLETLGAPRKWAA